MSISWGGQHRANTLILAALLRIEQKVDKIMSEDATIAAEAAAEETDIQAISGALASIQALLVALKGQGGLSQATLDAAAKVEADLGQLAGTAQADLAADQPPTPGG